MIKTISVERSLFVDTMGFVFKTYEISPGVFLVQGGLGEDKIVRSKRAKDALWKVYPEKDFDICNRSILEEV